ncbi:cob(I)yrinic acid a,c-diamide adenosyltransferase [Aeromonas sp. MdU4]|uniref:cob(I)yrinic acid a,c-diamide adenosyltransferase n=1 Tax=Aeromonas sp. MdU4 TaxID=3342819 RepID=UPI0035B80C24
MRNQERYQARQQRRQEAVAERVRQATEERGLLLVITGNGKGKTTAGFGCVLRAVGHEQQAAVAQFVKSDKWDDGARRVLERSGVPFALMGTGFTWDSQNFEADKAAAEKLWETVQGWLGDESLDLVMLDELTYMITYRYLELERVIAAIQARPAHQHVIITGRQCHRQLRELADTVSDIDSVKHAFDAGIKVQKGVDY